MIRKLKLILLLPLFSLLFSCGTTSSVLEDISLKMTKKEVKDELGSPDAVRGSIINKYKQTIEVWEYRLYRYKGAIPGVSPYYDLYWLYFADGILVQWGQAGDWQREADKIYEIRYK